MKIIIEFEPGEVHPLIDGGDGGSNYLAVRLADAKIRIQTQERLEGPFWDRAFTHVGGRFLLEGIFLDGEFTHYYPNAMPSERKSLPESTK